MPVISVRTTKKEQKFLEAMSTFYNMPVSSLLKEKSLPELEDNYDALAGENAYMNFMQDKQPAYTLDEARVKLGLKPHHATVSQVKHELAERSGN